MEKFSNSFKVTGYNNFDKEIKIKAAEESNLIISLVVLLNGSFFSSSQFVTCARFGE